MELEVIRFSSSADSTNGILFEIDEIEPNLDGGAPNLTIIIK